MVYLLKMVIFHGKLLNNQRVGALQMELLDRCYNFFRKGLLEILPCEDEENVYPLVI
jgi:hypothetical protein